MNAAFLSATPDVYIMPAVPPKLRHLSSLAPRLLEVEEALRRLQPARAAHALERFLLDSAAARFHLVSTAHPRMVVILGGTGTGKSTLVNRLLGANLSAASYRRTFTSGPVAVARPDRLPPAGWMALEGQTVQEVPARGQADRLTIVLFDHPLLQHLVLVDTPDLDGDQPTHHAMADRAFRWAHAVVFVVSPEKYQMTELPPYYRLAQRYSVPAVFVMNKADGRDVLDDYAAQLSQTHGISEPTVFCLPRDDAAFAPSAGQDIQALLHHLTARIFSPANEGTNAAVEGLRTRLGDVLSRGRDQVLQPLLESRAQVDRIIDALRAINAPTADVDVHPITSQLRRRLQQKSVLYLIGPQRILDRVRQIPLMLARLPRHTWDLLRSGQVKSVEPIDEFPDDWRKSGPDFRTALIDQFLLLQSRIEDLLRSAPQAAQWIASDPQGYQAARIDPAAAGAIADEELADLKRWLEERW
ncbi:MAG: GTPase domain-containing protein, partial [Phycisphaerae bacterium]|nr:GTPase domain-containing protein [Phycisphaerae bacterium]